MRALYPFVGGTASTHKFNLKNPLDTNAAYRLTFFGGVTHSSNGIIGNGTNGYADTFLANNVMAQSNAHISVYSRTNYQGTVSDIASYSNQFGSFMYIRGAGNNFEGQYWRLNQISDYNPIEDGVYLCEFLLQQFIEPASIVQKTIGAGTAGQTDAESDIYPGGNIPIKPSSR